MITQLCCLNQGRYDRLRPHPGVEVSPERATVIKGLPGRRITI